MSQNQNQITIERPNKDAQEQQASEEAQLPTPTQQNQSEVQQTDRYSKQIYQPRRTLSEQPTVQKPKVEKPKSGGISFQKEGKVVIPPEKKKPSSEKPHIETPSIVIEKPKTGEKKLNFQLNKQFTFSTLFDEWKKLDNESFTPFTIRSKGYIILKNYVLETEKGIQPNSSRSPRGRQYQGRGKKPSVGKSPSVATLIELNKDRFTSTQLEKNIGQWDETSDAAFKININQILNRLTPKNMETSIKEIKEQISMKKDLSNPAYTLQKDNNMTSKDREQYVAKTLVDKATKEQSFSDLYAQFTSKCSDHFQEKVVELNHSSINDSIVNPGMESDEQSSLMCNGSAKFFASLASVNLIKDDSLYDIIKGILDELSNEERIPHSHHIEMFNSFYLNVSPEIANKIDDIFDDNEIWTVIDKVMKIPTLKKRLYFLLLDVIEKRDKFRQNQDETQNTNKVVNDQSSKENMSKVRGAFSSYLESYTLPDIDLKSRDFFNAALEIFPDETKYYYDFCQFISSALKSMHAQKNDTSRILSDKVQKFKEQNIEKECPNVWANISTLINMFLLEDIITLDKANEIHKKFPEPVWDFNNSMKWYIYDFLDFSKAIHVSKWPIELCDALSMPERIDNLNTKDFLMSRLICVALIRTLYQKFKDAEMVNFHTFSKWKPQLALAAKRHPDTFRAEMEILFNDFEMTKTVDQFIDYCNKET